MKSLSESYKLNEREEKEEVGMKRVLFKCFSNKKINKDKVRINCPLHDNYFYHLQRVVAQAN